MSERHFSLLLDDIIVSAEKIIAYINSLNYEEFIEDDKTIDAVTRNFESLVKLPTVYLMK